MQEDKFKNNEIMRVNNYLVKWKYEGANLEFNDQYEFREITTCSILSKKGTVLSTGSTILNPSDPFDKDIARKRSLRRALKVFEKKVRKDFWETYRVSTKIPRWIKQE